MLMKGTLNVYLEEVNKQANKNDSRTKAPIYDTGEGRTILRGNLLT